VQKCANALLYFALTQEARGYECKQGKSLANTTKVIEIFHRQI